MKSRFVPVLEFVLDEGLKNSLEVNRLLNEEKARNQESEEKGPESEDDPEPPPGDEAPAADKLTPDS